MKLLMIYCTHFGYHPAHKTIDELPDVAEGKEFENAVVAFIHAESEDEENPSGVEKKLLKNLKWAAGKNKTKTIVLHSFAHLSESKASVGFTRNMFNNIEQRLKNVDYKPVQTAFGYFMDLKIDAPGYSLARLFQSF